MGAFVIVFLHNPGAPGGTAAIAVTDSDKISVQVLLDIRAFGETAAELMGCSAPADVDRELPCLVTIRSRVQDATRFIDSVPP